MTDSNKLIPLSPEELQATSEGTFDIDTPDVNLEKTVADVDIHTPPYIDSRFAKESIRNILQNEDDEILMKQILEKLEGIIDDMKQRKEIFGLKNISLSPKDIFSSWFVTNSLTINLVKNYFKEKFTNTFLDGFIFAIEKRIPKGKEMVDEVGYTTLLNESFDETLDGMKITAGIITIKNPN